MPQYYIADPDVHYTYDIPRSFNSGDSGDIELGRTQSLQAQSLNASSSSLSTVHVAYGDARTSNNHHHNNNNNNDNNNNNTNGSDRVNEISRPKQIQRGNSKSGIINCVTTGKEVIRTQSAFVRTGGHFQEPGAKKHDRRSSLVSVHHHHTSTPTAVKPNTTAARIPTKENYRRRRDRNLSNNIHNQQLDILTSHSSKHGTYMVSSRNSGHADTGSHSLHDGGGDIPSTETNIPSVEQYCLQKMAVRELFYYCIFSCCICLTIY